MANLMAQKQDHVARKQYNALLLLDVDEQNSHIGFRTRGCQTFQAEISTSGGISDDIAGWGLRKTNSQGLTTKLHQMCVRADGFKH